MNEFAESVELTKDSKKEPVPGVYLGGLLTFKTELVWPNIIFFLLLHLAALYGVLIIVFEKEITLHLYTYFVAVLGGEGVTLGAHRLWTHRAYKAKRPLRVVLMVMQSLAGENCIHTWARDHRLHHKYTDTDADPHNATRGFLFSHMGWLMMKKHPEVRKKYKIIDLSDLEADPVVMFQKRFECQVHGSRHFKKVYLVCGILLPCIIPYFLMGHGLRNLFFIVLCWRHVMLYHVTWTVNSLAHIFGYKPYDRNIKPTENWFVSLIAYGEGWHNYHHVFPWDYKASEYGRVVNASRYLIDWFSKMGWAYDLKEASTDMVIKKINRSGQKGWEESFVKSLNTTSVSAEEREKGW